MRDRLIELIKGCSQYICDDAVLIESIADHLLANGVIVPPCKVGQTVYVIATKLPCYACLACTDFCHRDCHFDDKTKLVVKKATVDAICFLEGANEIHVEIEETKNSHSYSSTYYFNDFGKTVFLTKELAEKALAERSISWGHENGIGGTNEN
jgi:hypothetical protein